LLIGKKRRQGQERCGGRKKVEAVVGKNCDPEFISDLLSVFLSQARSLNPGPLGMKSRQITGGSARLGLHQEVGAAKRSSIFYTQFFKYVMMAIPPF
jgi:hypothetical protein